MAILIVLASFPWFQHTLKAEDVQSEPESAHGSTDAAPTTRPITGVVVGPDGSPVTGAGGCGKSRLAVEVAARLLDEYSDGVWLVELAPLSDGRLLASTVANVLGVREQPGVDTLDVLTRFLGEKHLLLVVDNCEHLIEAVADLVAHLLGHTTDLRVVATSREPLHVRGEAVFYLPTLPVPDEADDWDTLTHVDSVRLFASGP